MVERVARALCVADGKDPDAVKAVGALRTYAGTGEDDWVAYIARSRAAIEAMREPTEGMQKAADREAAMSHYEHGGIGYRAMIDAALAEGTEAAQVDTTPLG